MARMRKAHAFLAGAELALDADEDEQLDLPGVAAALAVLAAIAATDAACCVSLGERARGQGHHEALAMLGTVRPHGVAMARDLTRLLDKKDSAHYGVIATTAAEAESMVGWTRRLLAAAQDVLES